MRIFKISGASLVMKAPVFPWHGTRTGRGGYLKEKQMGAISHTLLPHPIWWHFINTSRSKAASLVHKASLYGSRSLFLRFNTGKQTRSKSISILPKPFLLDVWVLGPHPRVQPVPPGWEHPGTSPGFLLSRLEVLRDTAGSPSVCPSSSRKKINNFFLTHPLCPATM